MSVWLMFEFAHVLWHCLTHFHQTMLPVLGNQHSQSIFRCYRRRWPGSKWLKTGLFQNSGTWSDLACLNIMKKRPYIICSAPKTTNINNFVNNEFSRISRKEVLSQHSSISFSTWTSSYLRCLKFGTWNSRGCNMYPVAKSIARPSFVHCIMVRNAWLYI